MSEQRERRDGDRIALEIPIELVTIPVSIEGTHNSFTKNISCSGLNCKLNRYIPPFTQVEVTLLLSQKAKSETFNQISFQGIIVRTEPADETDECSEYHIAIFVPSGIKFQAEQFALMLHDNQQPPYSD